MFKFLKLMFGKKPEIFVTTITIPKKASKKSVKKVAKKK